MRIYLKVLFFLSQRKEQNFLNSTDFPFRRTKRKSKAKPSFHISDLAIIGLRIVFFGKTFSVNLFFGCARFRLSVAMTPNLSQTCKLHNINWLLPVLDESQIPPIPIILRTVKSTVLMLCRIQFYPANVEASKCPFWHTFYSVVPPQTRNQRY